MMICSEHFGFRMGSGKVTASLKIWRYGTQPTTEDTTGRFSKQAKLKKNKKKSLLSWGTLPWKRSPSADEGCRCENNSSQASLPQLEVCSGPCCTAPVSPFHFATYSCLSISAACINYRSTRSFSFGLSRGLGLITPWMSLVRTEGATWIFSSSFFKLYFLLFIVVRSRKVTWIYTSVNHLSKKKRKAAVTLRTGWLIQVRLAANCSRICRI